MASTQRRCSAVGLKARRLIDQFQYENSALSPARKTDNQPRTGAAAAARQPACSLVSPVLRPRRMRCPRPRCGYDLPARAEELNDGTLVHLSASGRPLVE